MTDSSKSYGTAGVWDEEAQVWCIGIYEADPKTGSRSRMILLRKSTFGSTRNRRS